MILDLFRRREASSPASPRLVIVAVPALVDVLEALEAAKGGPLSEAEVIEVRDRAICVRVSPGEAADIIARERFHIDLATPYADWCRYRAGHPSSVPRFRLAAE